MKTPMVALAVLTMGWPAFAMAADPGNSKLSAAEIQALVERLASPNPRPAAYPEVHGSPEARYPKGYDKAAQAIVWQAYRDLWRLGPRAFPALLEHLDDNRYSLTGDTGNAEENLNVGFICRWLLRQQICPFNPTVAGEGYTTGHVVDDTLVVGPRGDAPNRPGYLAHLLSDRDKAKDWALKHESYPLEAIQEEALLWMIAEEAKDTKTYDLEERTALKSLLRELQTSESHLESSRSFFAK